MNKRRYVNIAAVLVFALWICAGCSRQQKGKYTAEELDNLAEIRIFSAENNELIKTIDDEELLYQYNQSVFSDDAYTEEQEAELKKKLEGAKEKYCFISFKYPVSRFGGKELEENTVITLFENTNIIKMEVSEASMKGAPIPDEFLVFYYEASEEEMDFYYSLIE